MANFKLLILLLIFYSVSAQRFIDYDCGSRSLNVTTLSLLNVGECDIPNENVVVKETYMQLLQLNDYAETLVTQCKVQISRSVFHCGMFSHISIAKNGVGEYIQEVGIEVCREMHRTGSYNLGLNHVIRGLGINHTSVHSVTFAGNTNMEGKCSGVDYSDVYGTWENVVVVGTVKISLWQQSARVLLDQNKVHLNSGTVSSLSEGFCLDVEGGETFWAPIPLDQCGFNRYGLLYEGLASKMTDHTFNETQVVYSLSTQDVTFALTAKGHDNVCGYNVIHTEHPKLVILETTKSRTFTQASHMSVDNLDIFAYVNSKFVYVEKHIRTQMKNLYRDALLQRCNLERQSLKNSLSIATQSPDEFAYHLMKGPGYMAVVASEVVHIIKCVPVEVTLQHGDYCYSELQVTRNNVTLFLSPRTHILKRKGSQIPCNALIPGYYLVGEAWLKIMPRPTEAKEPTIMKPMSRPAWKYINPENLATTGIYTEKDIKDLRERIMFPIEKPGILNDVAREMRGQPIADHNGSILRLLNDDAVEKITWSAWEKIWAEFMKFGTISAGVIAIFTVFLIFKEIIDIIMRGYTLYLLFGWSFRLLGAIWGSIAHCLIQSVQQTRYQPSNMPTQAPPSQNLIPPENYPFYPTLPQTNSSANRNPNSFPLSDLSPVSTQPQKSNPAYNLTPNV